MFIYIIVDNRLTTPYILARVTVMLPTNARNKKACSKRSLNFKLPTFDGS
eukprot:UN25806